MQAPRNGGRPPTRNIARWSSLVARRAHNPKVVGSNPALATNKALAGNGQGFLPSVCHISRARYALLGSGCSTERWLNPWRQFQSPGRSSRGFFFCLLPAESWLLRPWFCLDGFSYSLKPAKAAPGWHVVRMMRAASSLTECSCMCHFGPKECKLELGGRRQPSCHEGAKHRCFVPASKRVKAVLSLPSRK